jgi:hypothetical protein
MKQGGNAHQKSQKQEEKNGTNRLCSQGQAA